MSAPIIDAFSGNTRTWVADAILKWSPHGNGTERSLKVQAEYLKRSESGQIAQPSAIGPYRSSPSGWYLQSVYQFRPRWRLGARYDALDSGTAQVGLLEHATPSRVSVMFDWNPSEFTRLRAQYAWDDARTNLRDRQLMLQYLYSIGAHGAHKF